MLRVGMAALVMLLGSATATAAERPSDPSAGAVWGARQQSVASIAKARWGGAQASPAPRLRVGDSLALAGSSGRAVGAHHDRAWRHPSAPARALAQAPAADLSSHLVWLEGDDDDAALAYAVNEAWSLGLGYRLVTDETLELKIGETGAVDSGYTNHSVLLRAHWQF